MSPEREHDMKIDEAVELYKALGACGVPGKKEDLLRSFSTYAEAWEKWPEELYKDRYWLLFRVAGKFGSKSHRFACRVLGECLAKPLRRQTEPRTEARRVMNRVLQLLAKYGDGGRVTRPDCAEAAGWAVGWAAEDPGWAAGWAVGWAAEDAGWAAGWAVGWAAEDAGWAAEWAAGAAGWAAEPAEGTKAILARVSASWLERRMRATVKAERSGT